jgi:DHA3 family macrolide efflux protein-like MFS transporter
MPEKRWAPRFFTIWTGQMISRLGSRAGGFALVWWLTLETGSAQVLATATLGLILPSVLLGPLVGAYVDRWNRRLTIMVSDTGIALASLLLAYLFWTGNMEMWHVYGIIVLRAIGDAFHMPAIGASTTMLVPPQHLTRIAGLNQSVGGAMQVAGPIMGALLISVMPVHSIMLMDVGTAAIAVIPLLFLRIPQPTVDPSAERESIIVSIKMAFRFVCEHRGLLHIMLIASFMNFIINPVITLLPLLVTTHFGGTALHLGWLQSASGIGLIAGGLALSTWGGFRRKTTTLYVGAGLQGLALAVLGATPSSLFALAVVAMVANGLCNAMYNGSGFALLQATVPPQMQGRVFTLNGSIVQAAYPISLAILGPVVGLIGIRAWYIGGGLLVFAVCTAALFIPSIARLERQLAQSADRSAA